MGRSQLKRLKELEKKNQRLLRAVSDLKLDKLIMQEAAMGSDGRLGIDPVDQFRPERAEPMSPSSFRKCIEHVRQELGVSERRACRALGQHRSTQRKVPQGRADEERLTDDIIELGFECGCYGYRMMAGLLNNAGWHVNHKRVKCIGRREGLKVPQKQRKKGRLWLNY